jgi:hypothetical protein
MVNNKNIDIYYFPSYGQEIVYKAADNDYVTNYPIEIPCDVHIPGPTWERVEDENIGYSL